MYHMGVIKALIENGAMPGIISGTSGGSIVVGVLGIPLTLPLSLPPSLPPPVPSPQPLPLRPHLP